MRFGGQCGRRAGEDIYPNPRQPTRTQRVVGAEDKNGHLPFTHFQLRVAKGRGPQAGGGLVVRASDSHAGCAGSTRSARA